MNMNSKYVLSPYLHFVYDDNVSNQTIVFHSLFGNPRVVNNEGLRFLNLFKKPISVQATRNRICGNPREIIKEMNQIHFLIEPGENERLILKKRKKEQLRNLLAKKTIEHISLSVSNVCNFGCDYCMFFQDKNRERDKSFYGRRGLMSWETAKKCIDMYLTIMRDFDIKHGRIHFGNAEPLLNWEVIKRSLEYCETLDSFSFEFAINTNLSLFTEAIAETLKKHKVGIAASLDGLGIANDSIRVYKDGRGTFPTIIEKMDLLEKVGYPLDGISVVVTDKNFSLIDTEIIDFAHKRGMKSIAFDYDLIHCMSTSILERVAKLIRLQSYADNLGIYFDGTWGMPFRRLMSRSLLNEAYSFCAAVEGKGLTFNPDGSIKACDYSLNKVGHINQVNRLFSISSDFYSLVENRFPGSNNQCEGCIIEGFCGGLCQITREVAEKTSLRVVEDACLFFKEATRALIAISLRKGGVENAKTEC